MRKWILAIPALLLAVAYFLPEQRVTQTTFLTDLPVQVVLRTLADTNRWTQWWPGKKINDTTYLIGEKAFIKSPVRVNGFSVTHANGTPSIRLDVDYQAAPGNQTSFQARTTFLFSDNPFKKIGQHFDYAGWKKTAEDFNDSLKSYFNNDENIYGFRIRKEKVPNAHYISVSSVYQDPPEQAGIDSLVAALREYADAQQATIVNQPIMHVIQDGGKHKIMVALPTNRELPSGNGFQYKQMILGFILVADVRGGPHKIRQCQEAMERYMMDHGQSSPAIPFQRMLTDRARVKDTSNWMTAVNYPVFN
jgi:hypothetical protein